MLDGEHRKSARWQYGNRLRRRRRRRGGGHGFVDRCTRRGGNRRRRHEHRAEDRRQSDTGLIFVTGGGAALQWDNLTDALRDQGLTAATPLTWVYDVSGTLGGRIVQDRAWFFVNAHTGGSRKDSANVYYNLNAGDAAKWLYAPDLDRRGIRPHVRKRQRADYMAAHVGQQSERLLGCSDYLSDLHRCHARLEPLRVSPEAVRVLGRPLHVAQATWSSPVKSNLLVEASFGTVAFGLGNFEREPNPTAI